MCSRKLAAAILARVLPSRYCLPDPGRKHSHRGQRKPRYPVTVIPPNPRPALFGSSVGQPDIPVAFPGSMPRRPEETSFDFPAPRWRPYAKPETAVRSRVMWVAVISVMALAGAVASSYLPPNGRWPQ